MASVLEGSVAVVVGSQGRLGPTWVEALSSQGASVVGVDPVAQSGAADDDRSSRHVIADVRDYESMQSAASQIEREIGAPHILVNNAGIDQPPMADAAVWTIGDLPAESFHATLQVNVTGVFNAIRAFGLRMAELNRGSIVNIGSVYATSAPDPHLYDHLRTDPPFLKPPAYGASKAAVVNLTRYFARLWGPQGVRVNVLSPGGVGGGQDNEFKRKYSAKVALGRMAELQDLVGPLVFLASDASLYVTGQHLRVDGGFDL